MHVWKFWDLSSVWLKCLWFNERASQTEARPLSQLMEMSDGGGKKSLVQDEKKANLRVLETIRNNQTLIAKIHVHVCVSKYLGIIKSRHRSQPFISFHIKHSWRHILVELIRCQKVKSFFFSVPAEEQEQLKNPNCSALRKGVSNHSKCKFIC